MNQSFENAILIKFVPVVERSISFQIVSETEAEVPRKVGNGMLGMFKSNIFLVSTVMEIRYNSNRV